ncbi:M23 family metallopeptidase [Rhodococcus pyridinivorans]|uniref:M23 family metallopeptidase n=2 Tax=Rhodococcus TaxID=1827 RepID=A0A419YYS4_9NOCA|nr:MULTISPECIES: M23 family metallopeptidase [Rhodococcus]AOD24864.1 peptidase M24 [Rhodococcus sp. p52]AYA27436.1 M23 family metallopeptidase [Rhodococcus rhodochrous]MBX4170895.1 M23 family metallopeptidase [Rhodococcus sp. DMU2021]MCD5422257.1 M23 family metallopeptidase [Rhodococcus pyridinivorans]MCT7293828.1 M23 family metallopeptidase [Rhodococcus sp. PAE-6]
MGRHHASTRNQIRYLTDIEPGSAPGSEGRRGRHRAPTNRATTGACASSVATGALLIVGSQILAPGTAAAQPTSGGVHAAAPAPVPLPAELAALAALPEVEAALDQLAAVPGFPAVVSPAATVPALPSSSAVPTNAASWATPTLQPLAVAPVSGTLTSAFGPRWGSSHAGLDIANSIGTPVYAAASGTVIDSGPASGFGLWVQVRHDDGSTSTYGHINETLVEVDQRVQAGEQIATVGNRGQSTGPHLHFETTDPAGTKVDPTQWLQQRGVPPTDLSRMA